jgi:protein involved in polysaccharide export with SLBB domain
MQLFMRVRLTVVLWMGSMVCGAMAQAINPFALGNAGPVSSTNANAAALSLPALPTMRLNEVPAVSAATPAAGRSTDPAAPATAAAAIEAVRPNEFQRFVAETTGKTLPLFGLSFFDNVQFSQRATANPVPGMAGGLGFAALDNAPVSGDYLLGVGDQLVIRGWGSIDLDVRTAIDRNGVVNIPRVGAVPLAGVKAAQAESVLRQAIAKYYKDFQVSVTLAGLRGITVYVVGQARRPGSYTLSGVSTLASGLLATGGPGPHGSMRRVQLKRAGQLVQEFDFYAFLAKGDSSGDVKLTDGDVIVIPAALGHVALLGTVNNPAVYEIKRHDETLGDILEVAAGLPVVADPTRVMLERIQPEKSQPRTVQDFALDATGLKTNIKNGDMITIQAVLPELANAVTLRGNVSRPMRMAWRSGLRLRDLIPNREDLISRDSVRRQNEVLFADRNIADSVGNLYDEVNWEYAVIERIKRSDLTVELIPLTWERSCRTLSMPTTACCNRVTSSPCFLPTTSVCPWTNAGSWCGSRAKWPIRAFIQPSPTRPCLR